MKNIFLFLFFSIILFSQEEVTFSEHISPIIYHNCTECHRIGGVGPMPFTNYEQVSALGGMIESVTSNGYMPPWHADPEYSNFIGERYLTDQEKELISGWVNGGMIQGDPSLEADMPEFVEGSVLNEEPDEVLIMEQAYLVEGNLEDDYRVFVFSTNFGEDKNLKSIEIVPGNLQAVHHVLVNIDTDGLCAAQDAATPEYGYECESGFCTGNIPQLSAGYTPGMVPPMWNNDIGLVLPNGADIAIQIHYAPSSIDEYDQTAVNLFFKDEEIEREVQVRTLIDTEFLVPANEIYEHYVSYQIEDDISLISILPHMHLIGKSWLVYAENDGDTIPIINIPNWDFNWQTFYQPEYMLKLPQGYTIHAYATYDNTSSNPTNPNSPPQDVPWCDYTTCEMFFLPFSYVPYQDGDENVYLGNSEDLGCTDPNSCNYSENAIIDNGTCGALDDCGFCHIPCCFSNGQCDYQTSEQNCTNYWADISIVSDPTLNNFWNSSCASGCTDPLACNYDSTILPGGFDDGSCEYPNIGYDCDGNCLTDVDNDGICDEDECVGVVCEDLYECIFGECVCMNDTDSDGVCDELDDNQECLSLSILSINQINPYQFSIEVYNDSWDNLFSYPGFILFNSFGDTIAVEEVNYYGIAEESVHLLEIQQNSQITESFYLQLHTNFYENLICEWFELSISDNCALEPDPGPCFAAIDAYYYNLDSGECEITIWGGCGGVVPFWSMEECQASCEPSVIMQDAIVEKNIIMEFDVLGRDMPTFSRVLIRVYDDGTVEKKIIYKN